MQNTTNSLLRIKLFIILLSFFSLVSYAGADENAIDRRQVQQSVEQPPADKPLDAAKIQAKNPTSASAVYEPAKDEISIGKFFLGLVCWSFALFVMTYVYGHLVGTFKRAKMTLFGISLTLSFAATMLMVVNKFPTYPLNTMSGLLGWWIAQGLFIYLILRMDKKPGNMGSKRDAKNSERLA